MLAPTTASGTSILPAPTFIALAEGLYVCTFPEPICRLNRCPTFTRALVHQGDDAPASETLANYDLAADSNAMINVVFAE